MPLSLEDLRVFRAVARAGSFGRGAARLHLSQPAVSERMARLERDVRQPLFVRGQRGVRLTTAGERLLPYAERCLALADEALSATRGELHRARLRVEMHATFAPHVVPLVLDALASQNVDVTCSDAHSEDVIAHIHDGVADVGLVIPCAHPRNIVVEPFLADPVICVVGAQHQLATSQPLEVRDLTGHAIAWSAWGDGAERFLQLLQASQISLARLHRVSPAEAVATLARRGSHVGLVTRSTVARDLAAGTLVELDVLDLPPWDLRLALAYRSSDASSRSVRALRDALLDHR
jgi:DNA-binding transcriptional LysR family regulator